MVRSLFFPARHKRLADIITIATPEGARGAVRTLAKSGFSPLKIRSMVLAANRARASLHRRNLSARERREFREIAQIYESAVRSARRRR